jgi:hypothetical protein
MEKSMGAMLPGRAGGRSNCSWAGQFCGHAGRLWLREVGGEDVRMQLGNVPNGSLITVRDQASGELIVAMKSEYRYSNEPDAQCMCVLLGSGEYAHFEKGNRTLVTIVPEKAVVNIALVEGLLG